MANESRKKRKSENPEGHRAKRPREASQEPDAVLPEVTAGKIIRIFMRNFMCHDAMEVNLNQNVNFIVGRNGSGKSAILTALVVGLGAKANVTNRGTSIKEFVKKGKNSAVVEITVVNRGPTSYKPKVYGNSITISRCIGRTSSYRIKNAAGEVVSTRREELDRILSVMNIQVDNPISILNQDVSRTFLVTAGPKEKYELFMKATQLDRIGSNYKKAQVLSERARQQLMDSKRRIDTTNKEIRELEKRLEILESIEGVRAQHNVLKNELYWALAIAEERKLHRIQTSLEEQKNNLENHEEEVKTRESKENHIKAKIEELRERIREIEAEAAGSSDAYNVAKKEYINIKETYTNKTREWRSVQNKMKRLEEDIKTLRKEIQRLESESSQVENERHQIKAQLSRLEQQLDEVEATLRTKQTDQMHLDADWSRLAQEERSAKIYVDHCDNKIRQNKRQLNELKKESGNAVTVFGSNMPRILKRIKEEFDRGRFKQMPRGPLGSYMKMRDPAWAAAVENYLGAGILRSFCVDNAQDAKTLGFIMKEVFRDEGSPQIISSKFYYQVHNVERHCTQAPGYVNLLDAMEISDPVVANCLIDQREVECVLLIPTSQEACEMMSDACRVPPNCKRSLTQQGDTFFPDPNYRSYGGRPGMRARYLQVSTTEAIKVLEEELASAEEERVAQVKQHRKVQEMLQQTKTELTAVKDQVNKLRSGQHKIKATMNELRDKCEVNETNSVAVFTGEIEELEKKLEQEAVGEKPLKAAVEELQKKLRACENEVKRRRELRDCLDSKLDPIKQQIRELENEQQMLRVNSQYSERRLAEAKQAMQKLNAEFEGQQRVTEKSVAEAAEYCPRMNTQRSAMEINRMVKELQANIQSIEEEFGSKDEIREDLAEKREKYDGIIKFATNVETSNNKHLKRLEIRRREFHSMKKHIGLKMQQSFENVLSLRKYTGTLTIDHQNRLLHLEVNPESSINRVTNDARSLSGGERSYSTVAFILALWDCINLPFYFLDEFDVFMDKVNRRVIMDILLDHTKSHPNNQFAFLTPLDTSNVLAEEYVTIHKLAPPERNGNDA